jgi:ADP-ribose pyrophosphatase YjhB (NUDIX family)
MRSLPRVTVASVLERDGKFLLVEETVGQGHVLNQPAGHLELNETLVDAVVRETLEETAWLMRPTHLTGIYRWSNTQANITYVRFCFTGELLQHQTDRPLDKGIVAAHWLSVAQLKSGELALRSPLVLRCIEDYLAGQRYDLNLITEMP